VPTCLDRAIFGNPAESSYLLPYPVGKRYMVDQNYCQPGSSHSNQLAYDFAMELGDEVTAARAGRVAEVVESYADDDTNSSHFNYIFIIHEDGTVAFYAHLMQDGILVAANEMVEPGQVIARVGHSAMPANYKSVLHFGVYASWPPTEGYDKPVNFRNAGGVLDSHNGLARRSYYEALPWSP
jgi:murein DD-endopeptidase MepM/ murein hydrolase activator NlpD